MVIDTKSQTFMHRFGFNEEDERVLPRRVVFVLDKSGSMWGIWKQAQEAIIGAVENLREEFDRFGIVLFDDRVYRKEIRIAHGHAIKDRVSYLRGEQPGSATNLYGGIEAAMKMIEQDMIDNSDSDSNQQFVNQVVFVTDGMANVGVTRDDQILDGIHRIQSRLSSPITLFGIGIGEDRGKNWVYNLNYPLIRRISMENGGFDKRVKQSETKQDLSRYYKILQTPQLAHITVEYQSDALEISKVTQHEFSALYAGTDLVICGKYHAKSVDDQHAIKAVIQSSGGESGQIEKVFGVRKSDEEASKESMNIDRIWAYLSLKHYERLLLLNEGKANYAALRLINEDALNIALSHKLVTPWTSMIVVAEKQDTNIEHEMKPPTSSDPVAKPTSSPSIDIDVSSISDEELGEMLRAAEYFEPDDYEYYDDDGTAGILLLDVTPLSLGVADKQNAMIKLIEKNSVIPTKKSTVLRANQLPQIQSASDSDLSGVVVKVYQGERVNVTENILLTEFEFKCKVKHADEEAAEIEITFEIDANGILYVTAKDELGVVYQTTVSADKGRPSQEEIDEMLRTADEFAEEDARMAEAMQAKNVLESAAYNLKNLLDDEGKLGGKLSEADKDTLYEAANDAIDWLDDNPDAERDEYLQQQREFDAVVQPVLKPFYAEYPEYAPEADEEEYYMDHEEL